MIDTNHLSTLELLQLSVTAFLPINQTLFLPALRCNQTTISKHLLLCYCFKRILTGNMFRERPWGLHLKHMDYTFAWILLTTPGKISEGTRNKSYLWTLWSSPRRENYNRKFLKKFFEDLIIGYGLLKYLPTKNKCSPSPNPTGLFSSTLRKTVKLVNEQRIRELLP